MILKSLETLLDVVFPPRCAGCEKEGRYLCERCEVFCSEAAFICPACQLSSFTGERHSSCATRWGVNGLVNAWEYDGVIKQAIHCVKYGGVTHMINELADRALRALAILPERSRAFFSFFNAHDTLLTFSPMWPNKERIRGFNQAELLARVLARRIGKRSVSLLLKIRDTKAQVNLEQKERFANVRDSVKANGAWSVRGRNIVVVDDVWTTGATMRECSRALKRAGARDVWGFTIARTP